MLKLLAENIPTHSNSPFSPYLPGFTALRLLLLKRNRTPEDNDLCNTMLDSYSSYLSSGRNSSETAWMVARDFMLLTQTTAQQPTIPQPLQQQAHTQQQDRALQIQHQPLHQQFGQTVASVSQQSQHNGFPLTQQLHTNQYQKIDTIQNSSHHSQVQIPHPSAIQQQQKSVTSAPLASAPGIHSAPGSSNNLPGLATIQGQQHGLSALGHFGTVQNGQNSLSQNGIAALSHVAQQHQMTHTNGLSLPNDKV